jgi:polar amino acid transport system permease protein
MSGVSEFLSTYLGYFIEGAGITIILSLVTVLLGAITGTLFALMKLSNSKVLRGIATVYIEIIRGTPLIVQVFILYFGTAQVVQDLGYTLPQIQVFGNDLVSFASIVLAMTLNSTAYIAEIIRSGIESIDKGQMEAARSLGLTHRMAMTQVIIPQAIKNILPALGNEFITVIKESSIVSVVGIRELMFSASVVQGTTYKIFTPLITAAVLYFILTFTLSKVLGIAERRMKASD